MLVCLWWGGIEVWLKSVLLALLLVAGVAQASSPVVFVLSATDQVVVTNPKGQQYSALPTQRLLQGHTVTVPKGQRFSVLVLKTGNRRVYNGPAQLRVIADTVRVLSGPSVKVFPVEQAYLDLIDQWINLFARPRGVPQIKSEKPASQTSDQLRLLQPLDGSLLLTRNPVFIFQGDLPREGNLMLFDSKGKRFWVEPLESQYVSLPPAAKFEWGQSFTWEVRRLTGGRVVSGSFHIASEETARSLLEARVPDTADTSPELKLFYGMRLQLAKAFKEANEVWSSLDMVMSAQGQPSRIRP